MSTPRTLVVYFSLSGHSCDIAKAIARRIGADIEEIKWNRPGVARFGLTVMWRLTACRVFGRSWPILASERDAASYDLVIIGGPIWVGRLAPPVMAWLKQSRLPNNVRLALFATAGRTTPFPRAFADVAELTSRTDIVAAHFPDAAKASDAEAEQVRTFCEFIVTARSLAA